MNVSRLLPALDPAPLPGPSWLFQCLWVLTFVVHLLLVDTVLGGTLLALIGSLRAPRPGARETVSFFVQVNSWAIALAVTFGIAPLLFTQLLFGRFFYTATILLARAWLGLLVFLMAAYYLNYLAKRRLRAGGEVIWILGAEALLFLIIAGIQVSINLTHLQPERWAALDGNAWAILADPTFVPRYLHFVLAAIATSGALIAWWSVRGSDARGDPALEARASFGVRAALLATALQIADGFWLLLALPGRVLLGLMRGGAGTMWPLTLGILVSLGALMVLALAYEPLARPKMVRHSLALIAASIVLMIVTRHQLRAVYLAPARAGEQLREAPQWGLIALFAVILVLSVAAAAIAVGRAVRDRPARGEPVA